MSPRYESQNRYQKSLFVPVFRTVPFCVPEGMAKCSVPYRGIFRYPERAEQTRNKHRSDRLMDLLDDQASNVLASEGQRTGQMGKGVFHG